MSSPNVPTEIKSMYLRVAALPSIFRPLEMHAIRRVACSLRRHIAEPRIISG